MMMTMWWRAFFLLALAAAGLMPLASSSTIAFVLPVSTRSHKNVFMPLAQALSARGHEVHVFSSHTSNKKGSAVKDYAVPGMEEKMSIGSSILWSQMGTASAFGNILMTYFLVDLGSEACDLMLGMPEVEQFLSGRKKLDLVIQSVFFEEACLGLVAKTKAPFIYLSTTGNWPHLANGMGFTEITAAVPSIQLPYGDKMSFFQRVLNTAQYHLTNAVYHLVNVRKQNAVMRKYLGEDYDVRSIHENASLAMLNTAPGVDYRNPLPKNFIEVGGMHCVPALPLPKDLEEWVTGSSKGFIFFSLGSAVQGKMMPEKFRKMFIEAFSRLSDYRILWKWETEVMEGLPKHVKLSKWLPQQDLLGHKNIKLFITHGGLLSTQEATYHGVPVVGIPIGADQMLNMKKTEMEGAGLTLEWATLSTDKIYEAVSRVLTEPSFAENLKRRSSIMRDQQETPLERAVFWTEYVIRHKGAPHLRSAARDLTWWQYHLLDVWAFIIAVVLGALLTVWFVARTVFRLVASPFRRSDPSIQSKKRK